MVRVHRRAECSSSCEGLNWGRELDGRKLACFLNLRATRSLASSTHPHLQASAEPMILVSEAASTQSPRPGTACSPARCPAAPPSARPPPAISHEQPPENVRHPTELTRRGSKNGARPCNPPHQDSLPSLAPVASPERGMKAALPIIALVIQSLGRALAAAKRRKRYMATHFHTLSRRRAISEALN